MAHTAQTAINNLRIMLGETDKLNSRWDDAAHLLYYFNLGRRMFAKESKVVKALFEQTLPKGVTLGNTYARHVVPPELFEIDEMYWDDTEVERAHPGEWEEQLHGIDPSTPGRPYVYRFFGDAIDLYFAPDKEAVLEIWASIVTTDLPALGSSETELNDDQVQIALYAAASQALTDDDRDGTIYEGRFNKGAKEWHRARYKKGPRYVEQTFTRKHRRL